MWTFRMKRLAHSLCLLSACVVILPVTAQTPQPVGPSIQVNTTAGGSAAQVAWRCDADITLIVWVGASQGSDPDASIQGRFFSGPAPVSPQFQVNQSIEHAQVRPKVRVLDNGDFAVAWRTQETVDGPYSFHFRTYDRITLAPRAEQNFGPIIEDHNIDIEFSIAGDGRVSLVWEESPFVHAQIYDPNGQPSGPELSVEAEPEVEESIFVSEPFIHMDTERTTLGWRTLELINFEEDRTRVQYQRFQLDGSLLGSTVTTITESAYGLSAGFSISDLKYHFNTKGEAVFSYLEVGFPSSENERFSIVTRRFSEDGQQTQFVRAYSSYYSILGNRALDVEADGDFAVIWNENQTPAVNRIAVGEPDPGPRFNPVDTSGTPRHLAMDYNGPGSPFAVVWVDNGIHWRRFLSFPDMLLDGFESGDTSRWCVARSGQ